MGVRGRPLDRQAPATGQERPRDARSRRGGAAGDAHKRRARRSDVSRSSVTIGDYLNDWLADDQAPALETTWYSHSVAVKPIAQEIGAVRLQALTPLQIEKVYVRLLASGGKEGGPLAPRTARNCHMVIHRALSDGERLGVVSRNAAHAAKAPVARRPSPAQGDGDLDRRGGDGVPLTGCRRSAVGRVRPAGDHRDEEGGGPRPGLVGPRRGRSAAIGRSDPDDDQRRGVLGADQDGAQPTRRRPGQRERRRAEGAPQASGANDWRSERGGTPAATTCFREVDGRSLHPDRFTAAFKWHVRASDLAELRGPHSLRHTWATLALKVGVYPKVVSDRLGHFQRTTRPSQ